MPAPCCMLYVITRSVRRLFEEEAWRVRAPVSANTTPQTISSTQHDKDKKKRGILYESGFIAICKCANEKRFSTQRTQRVAEDARIGISNLSSAFSNLHISSAILRVLCV